MAENKKDAIKEAWDVLHSIDWKVDDKIGTAAYLIPDDSAKYRECISILRRLNGISQSDRAVLNEVVKSGEKGYREHMERKYKQPRVNAQKFIGKKNIRLFIIRRDGHCLRCGTYEKLSLDHIVPINRDGENKIMNLQTLCCSCNSWKSNKIIDFRPGARVLNIHRKTQYQWNLPVTL